MWGCSLTADTKRGFIRRMRFAAAVFPLASLTLVVSSTDGARPAPRPAEIETRRPVPPPNVQAQEISYRNVRGTRKTEFRVIGDDYFDDGRVIAWRCLLIENGRIVAENRSFMWE